MPKSYDALVEDLQRQRADNRTRNMVIGKVFRGTNISVNAGKVDSSDGRDTEGRTSVPIGHSPVKRAV